MIYNNLDEIPLKTFISVYLGDYSYLVIKGTHDKEELEKTARDLIMEYLGIVRHRSIQAEIMRKNERITHYAKIDIMNSLKAMISKGMWEEVCSILYEFGYTIKQDNHAGIKMRIESILANSKFRLDSIPKTESSSQKPDKDYFIREKIMVMAHYKMQFSSENISAKEYAYLVKGMCDEIDSLKRFRKK